VLKLFINYCQEKHFWHFRSCDLEVSEGVLIWNKDRLTFKVDLAWKRMVIHGQHATKMTRTSMYAYKLSLTRKYKRRCNMMTFGETHKKSYIHLCAIFFIDVYIVFVLSIMTINLQILQFTCLMKEPKQRGILLKNKQ
jgi:hypothetical protein